MQNRQPVAPNSGNPLPDFAPVPRGKGGRHDGWTPDRQRAFIEALADTGCVKQAAHLVNMSHVSAYRLRRAAGAEGFRRAWEAALDFGLLRMKDIAYERAVEGQLVPVLAGGKVLGFRRVYNDRLLMFVLSRYGRDANGKRISVTHFSSKASATASPSPLAGEGDSRQRRERGEGSPAPALAQTATTHTRITAPAAHAPMLDARRTDTAADILEGFEGVPLDAEAHAAIRTALESCATRQRELAAEDNPEEPWVSVFDTGTEYAGPLQIAAHDPGFVRFQEGEVPWTMLGDSEQLEAIEAAVASVEAGKKMRALPEPD